MSEPMGTTPSGTQSTAAPGSGAAALPGVTPSSGAASVTAAPAVAALTTPGPSLAGPSIPGRTPVRYGQGLDAPAKLGLVIITALLAVSWYHTFAEMWLRWFPAWPNERMTLTERLTEGESYYTHGPLVPLICLFIAYVIHKRVGFPTARSRSATLAGWSLLAVFLATHLLSVYARVMFVSGFSLVGVIAGLVLVVGGWPLMRAYWLPVLFLGFMVPLPEVAIFALNFKLKMIAGNSAVWLTNHVFDVPCFVDGAQVILPEGADGLPKRLVIENVCGGLRSLIALTFFASLFAVVCRLKGPWRLVMLALAVPVAVGSNIVRITSLNIVAHYFSVAAAGPESWFHNTTGLAVFAVALGILFGVENGIIKIGSLMGRNWADPRLMGFLDRIPKLNWPSPSLLRVDVLAVLVAVTVLSLVWANQAASMRTWEDVQSAAPTSCTIQGTEFNGSDFEVDAQTRRILETDDILSRRYQDMAYDKSVDLMIVFSKDNRKGTHPPEVCLEGSQHLILERGVITIPVAGLGPVKARELISDWHGQKFYHLYLYKCGDSYTPSFYVQQATILFNGMFARNAAGALIRFTIPLRDGTQEEARELALASVYELMPKIDERLP